MNATFLGSKIDGRGRPTEFREIKIGDDVMITNLDETSDYGVRFRGIVTRVWTNVIALNGRKFKDFTFPTIIPSEEAWNNHAEFWSEAAAKTKTA